MRCARRKSTRRFWFVGFRGRELSHVMGIAPDRVRCFRTPVRTHGGGVHVETFQRAGARPLTLLATPSAVRFDRKKNA